MVIDFHTHIFPKDIAEKTIDHFKKMVKMKTQQYDYPDTGFYTDGTLESLKLSMKESGIDYSVILPVVTKPAQFEAINRYAALINGNEGIISFGGIHPHTRDYKADLGFVKSLGLAGIKIHPDYQKTYINDPRYIKIIEYASQLDLIVLTHAGDTLGISEAYCTPQKMRDLINRANADFSKVIVAHAGGFHCWDDVEKYLVGQSILFDLSSCFGHTDDLQIKRIIKNHGADKILFGSDSPWEGQKETLERFRRLDLTDGEMAQILFTNGAKLLKSESS